MIAFKRKTETADARKELGDTNTLRHVSPIAAVSTYAIGTSVKDVGDKINNSRTGFR